MYKQIHATITENWATHSIDNNNYSNNMTKSDWLSFVQHVFRTFVYLPSKIEANHLDFSLKSWNVTHLEKLQSTVF